MKILPPYHNYSDAKDEYNDVIGRYYNNINVFDVPKIINIWFDGNTFFGVSLKVGSQYMVNLWNKALNKNQWFGCEVILSINDQGDYTFRVKRILSNISTSSKFNTKEKITDFLNEHLLNNSKYNFIVFVRNPEKRIYSAIAQSIKNRKLVSFFKAEFEKKYPEESYELEIFKGLYENAPWNLEEFLRNEMILNLKQQYIDYLKVYLKFVIEEYIHILLIDWHVRIHPNYFILKFLLANNNSNKVKICNMDKIDERESLRKTLTKFNFINNNINTPKEDIARHSSSEFSNLVKQVIKESSMNVQSNVYRVIHNENSYFQFLLENYKERFI